MALDEEQKNINFVQFSRAVMADYRKLALKSPLAVSILTFFLEKMDRYNAIVCSYRVLEDVTGYSRRSVARAIGVLKSDRWIQAVKVGGTHAYLINSAAFWSTYNNRKKYSQFHALVISSAEEQDESQEVLDNLELKRLPIVDNRSGERVLLDNEELPPPDQQDLDIT